MAFAQLTYRESRRDIERCLSAQASNIYRRGLSQPVKRTSLAGANELRDRRICAEFAQRLAAAVRNGFKDGFIADGTPAACCRAQRLRQPRLPSTIRG